MIKKILFLGTLCTVVFGMNSNKEKRIYIKGEKRPLSGHIKKVLNAQKYLKNKKASLKERGRKDSHHLIHLDFVRYRGGFPDKLILLGAGTVSALEKLTEEDWKDIRKNNYRYDPYHRFLTNKKQKIMQNIGLILIGTNNIYYEYLHHKKNLWLNLSCTGKNAVNCKEDEPVSLVALNRYGFFQKFFLSTQIYSY